MNGLPVLALLLAAGNACQGGVLPEADLERMIDQEKALPYTQSAFFDDRRAMRPPPLNTVPQEAPQGPTEHIEGLSGNAYVTTMSVPMTRGMMQRGRERFEIFCAACHGVRGDGDTWTARSMMQRKPPALIEDRVRAFPPGRIFRVITDGYGLMRSYAYELSVDDRWAVVSYLRALQLSQSVPLRDLPPAVRRRAEEKLQ